MIPETEKQMELAIEQALRGGNPEDAARVIMTYRNCTLDAGRREISERLKQRARR
ncbi:MAG TPA: hypothetical protein VGL61_19640 [Kofleriaceae bacterium]|jgi:hypothetical protein